MLGGKTFLGDRRVISIDPHIPYLYIPNADWTDFAQAMTAHYSNLICEFSKNRCYFDIACGKLNIDNIPFEIRIYDV